MAESPLLISQLLASQQQGNDPALAAFTPRLQLAQAMMQEGMSNAPTNKWGGLSRLASALVGNYAFNNASQGLQDYYKGQQDDFNTQLNSIMGGQRPAPQAQPQQPQPQAQPQQPQPQALSAPPSGGNRPSQMYAPIIQASAARAGIPPAQLASALDKESGGTPNPAEAVNPQSGASGTAQILPSTATNPGFGVQPISVADTKDPTKAIPFAADYVANRAKAAGLDMNNPQDAVKAWNLYGGDKSGAYGASVVGNAGSPPAPSAPGGSAPAADPLQHYHDLQRLTIAASGSLNPTIKARAPILAAMATQELDRLENTYTETPTGAVNGLGKPVFQPSPRMATDVHGNLISVGPGGVPSMISPNVSGISGNSPEANSARLIAELGPKIKNGTATDQEKANYKTAARLFQNFKTVTTGPTQTVTQAPSVPLPDGMPETADGVTQADSSPKPTSTGTPPLVTPNIPKKSENTQTIVAPDPIRIAEIHQAETIGSKSGEQAAATLPRMVAMGQDASKALGTIQSARDQLAAASAKGLTTGYFGPAWATGLAAMKSAGMDTRKFGVDPSAIEDIQAGRKSLALVAGNIIQQIIGPNAQETEGKIAQFIHATPGIETDPGALNKILDWAQSQAEYNRDMAHDAMKNADPKSGIIPPGWEAQYYVKQNGNFGPIYNPLHGKMEQPNDQNATSAPAIQTGPPDGATARHPDGRTAVRINGKWVIQPSAPK